MAQILFTLNDFRQLIREEVPPIVVRIVQPMIEESELRIIKAIREIFQGNHRLDSEAL